MSHEFLVPQKECVILSNENYCHDYEITLTFKKKSNNTCKINDMFTIINCKYKKIIYDNNGQIVIILKKNYFNIFQHDYNIYLPSNSKKSIGNIKSKLKTFIMKIPNKPTMVLKSDILNKHGKIFLGNPEKNGEPIGLIDKALFRKKYKMTITKNVDLLYIVIFCILFNERKKNKHKHKLLTLLKLLV
jgi:hypothetical protein